MSKRHVIIPIFVPHKGCPNDCIFCNQKKISGQLEEMTPEKIDETVNTYLGTIGRDTFTEIAFYGGSFTAIDKEQQEVFLSKAWSYVSAGRIEEIRISTRPDRIDEDTLRLLKKYGVRTIELGVQSLDDEVLRNSLRGHDSVVVHKAAKLIKDMGSWLRWRSRVSSTCRGTLRPLLVRRHGIPWRLQLSSIFITMPGMVATRGHQ